MLQINHLIGFGAVTPAVVVNYATWNPSDKNAGITLTNGNLTEAGGPNIAVRSTAGKSTGKWMAEFTINANFLNVVGIEKSTASLSTPPGNDANGWAYASSGPTVNNGSNTAYGAAYTNADVISVAWDATNGRVFFAKNGVWQSSGDPATGTNPAYSGLSGTMFLTAGSFNAGTQQVTLNCGQSAFTATLPSGFSGWTDP